MRKVTLTTCALAACLLVSAGCSTARPHPYADAADPLAPGAPAWLNPYVVMGSKDLAPLVTPESGPLITPPGAGGYIAPWWVARHDGARAVPFGVYDREITHYNDWTIDRQYSHSGRVHNSYRRTIYSSRYGRLTR